jgi:Flp pilus assembly protein TadB
MVARTPGGARAISRRVSNGDSREPSTRALMSNALSDAASVVRAEVKLAALEIKQDAKNLATAVPMGAAGGLIGTLGLVFAMVGMMLGLAVVIPAWGAALIVGGVAIVGAVVLFAIVRKRIAEWNAFVPERALEMLAENRQWMRQRLS